MRPNGEPAEVAECVAAVLREIAGARAERAEAPVRSARLRLAAIHGATRLKRRREREGCAA